MTTCSLVLSSVGIAHRVAGGDNGFELYVAPGDRQRALRQLAAYFTENRSWPPVDPVPAAPVSPGSKPPTLIMMAGLALLYAVTGPWTGANPWFQRGAVDSVAITGQGQWWRLFCALTLHGDEVHLLGNLVIGGFLVHLLCRSLGSGSGLLLTVLAGGLGNLVNIAVRDSPHLSVGFSTSIFGIIGIFTGSRLWAPGGGISRLLAPLGAGAGLLAFLGTEGMQTDLGAHFFGFAVGLALGVPVQATGLDRYAANKKLQRSLWTATMLFLILAWLRAWNIL